MHHVRTQALMAFVRLLCASFAFITNCRVLQPGGSFLLVTLGDPTRRLPMLCDSRLPWKVSLLLLPKISAANQAYVDGK